MGKTSSFLILLIAAASIALSSAKIPLEWLSGFKSFISGGVGGVCCVLVGHPFDLVKVRMQTADDSDKSEKKGTLAMLREIAAVDGFKGLYRGVSAPIIAVAPIFAISFWGFDMGDRIVRSMFNLGSTPQLNIQQLCIAGGFSALPTAFVMVPSERIKCILQTQGTKKGEEPKYKSFGDCAQQLFNEKGLSGLYKGTTLTLMRDIPANIAYFGVYEIMKRQFLTMRAAESASQLSPLSVLVAGGIAGMATWAVAIPPDTLKTRYQTAPDGTYKGVWDVYSQLTKDEGISALFRGIGPAMIRAFPANAVTFLGAEATKSVLTFVP